MSIYFTPSEQLIDEETSHSEDSAYTTPEISFCDSVFNVCCTPRTDEDVSKSCSVFEWKSQKLRFDSSPIENRVYCKKKCPSDSLFDKENIGCSSSKKHRRSSEGRALKSITTVLNFEPLVKADYDSQINEYNEQNGSTIDSTIPRSFFQKMGFVRKLKRKCKIMKEKNLPDISVDTDGEAFVIRIPKKDYGSLVCRNTNEEQKTETNSSQKAQHSIDKTSFSVLRKFRLSPLKRLFTRSVTGICSCYTKYLSKSRYQFLNTSNESVSHNSADVLRVNTEKVIEQAKIGVNSLKNLNPSAANVEDLMQTIILKLSSIESELKDIKNLAKERNCHGSVISIPPPPPPPPPLPSLLLGNLANHSSTPKRKVDLTTPENDQLAKRPFRVQEQRTQFSVTVEDLQKVKLRKIGHSSAAKKTIIDMNSNKEPTSLPASARIGTFRYRRNRTIKRDLSEIAAELLSPKKNDVSMEPNLMSSPITPNTPHNSTVYELTPKITKRRSSIFRTGKRKELINSSPVRKRLNSSGLSSPKNHNSISDVPDIIE